VALLVSGSEETQESIEAGLDFLQSAQLDSGGWEYASELGENANSTAMVVLALTFLGQDQVSEDNRWLKDGVSPIEALLAWQGESGAFQADFGEGPFDDFFSTVQSLPALGFNYMRTTGQPAGTATVPEMTPTSTATAVEATATPERPTVTAEPTQEPTTTTPESVAESPATAQPESGANDNGAAGDADGGASSVLPWILAIGAAVVLVGLVWWFISKRREA
jgi:cobalamin biosynthesis Mg chelatase CobN